VRALAHYEIRVSLHIICCSQVTRVETLGEHELNCPARPCPQFTHATNQVVIAEGRREAVAAPWDGQIVFDITPKKHSEDTDERTASHLRVWVGVDLRVGLVERSQPSSQGVRVSPVNAHTDGSEQRVRSPTHAHPPRAKDDGCTPKGGCAKKKKEHARARPSLRLGVQGRTGRRRGVPSSTRMRN
jgi:hypothetical protein